MASDTVWCVIGGGIVVCTYHGPKMYTNAKLHAKCIVSDSCERSRGTASAPVMRALVYAELRTELPPDIKRDLEISEWEDGEDITPVEIVDLDDQ